MIVLMTDFGLAGPYIGQMKAVLYREAPHVPVIDLFADLPAFEPRRAAYLLPAYVSEFPLNTVFLCIVDPGVGSARQPLIVKADDQWFVGPDNGLFHVVCKRAKKVLRWLITYKPPRLSASFHGRDLFAPVAAKLALNLPVSSKLLTESSDQQWALWPDDLFEVVYIDHYGNAMTGIRAATLRHTDTLVLKYRVMRFARTFSEASPGVPFWYENANGLVEISIREGNVSTLLDLKPGDSLRLA